MSCSGNTKTVPIETHAEAPTKGAKAEAADQSQLAIQDRKVASARVVCVALFIKFEEAESEAVMSLEAAAGAAAEAHVVGSGYTATAAALRPTMRALSNSTGLGFAHFGALAGVGKSQPSPSHACRQRKLVLQALCAQSGGDRYRC